jgi:2-oxoglutarate ferredoxin oxidoreductase subunit beta
VEDPFRPAELAIGARGKFFARIIDTDVKNAPDILVAAAKHKGASVTEVILNCVIFNDGINESIINRDVRADKTITLKHGEKMIFGKDNNRGIVQDGFNLKAVTIGEGGYTLDKVLVHDATTVDPTLHLKLALMDGGELPVALGIIRDVEAPTYDQEVEKQIADVQAKKPSRKLRDYLLTLETWEVK